MQMTVERVPVARADRLGRRRVGARQWIAALIALAALVYVGTPTGASDARGFVAGQPAAESEAAPQHGNGAGEGEGHSETGLRDLVARLVNFGILVGVLVYFLRTPLATYLKDRSIQIRSELDAAAESRRLASEQLAEVDRRLQALPGEVAALKARGTEEIAAEDARIRQAATTERERLLEQARREISLQLRVAERELRDHAAHLAVGVAADRIKKEINAEDHLRLVDRYLAQVRPHE